MDNHFDLIVIGGGSAGYSAASTAQQAGQKVAIIDGADELGGLCILRGCMPSKTLIYIAEVLHMAKRGREFGLAIPEAQPDMKAVHQRKLDMIEDFASYRRSQLESDRFTLFRDYARFVNEDTVELVNDGTRLTAEKFIIASGSRVNFPRIPGLDRVPVWTSDDILELDELPERVLVLGGGVVATELAQYLRRMGSEVTMIQRSPKILKTNSRKAAGEIERAFTDEGMKVYTDTKLQEILQLDDGKIRVNFTCCEEQMMVEFSHIFNALGRVPNTDKLGLEEAGISATSWGLIEVNEFQQTSNPRVYAVGDCCGPEEIVHIAVMQGELAARHAFELNPKPINYDHISRVVFTDPQVATVGMSQAAMEERGIPFCCAEYQFNDHGKSLLMGATYGYVKVWARKPDGVVIAAECVGKDAGELIHSMVVAVTLGATVDQLLSAHWYHPTLSEIWTYPLEDISDLLQEQDQQAQPEEAAREA